MTNMSPNLISWINKCLVRKQRKYGVHFCEMIFALVNPDCIATELRVRWQNASVFWVRAACCRLIVWKYRSHHMRKYETCVLNVMRLHFLIPLQIYAIPENEARNVFVCWEVINLYAERHPYKLWQERVLSFSMIRWFCSLLDINSKTKYIVLSIFLGWKA